MVDAHLKYVIPFMFLYLLASWGLGDVVVEFFGASILGIVVLALGIVALIGSFVMIGKRIEGGAR